MSKYGHITGQKREKKNSSAWYKTVEAENLKRIEREWAAKQQGK